MFQVTEEMKKAFATPSSHVQACPRVKVASLPSTLIPKKYIEDLEHNQKIAHCCRHPENHDIEAKYSAPHVKELKQPPDIYIFHCTCGRRHIRFCVGGGDVRPFWG